MRREFSGQIRRKALSGKVLEKLLVADISEEKVASY
jgi:hypothetical protein